MGWRAEGPSDFSTPRLGGVLSRCSVCGFLHIERAVRLPYARLCAQSCVVFRQVPNLTTQFTSHGLGWPEKQVFRHYSKSAERRVWTQDPLVIKQMLYHWATLPSVTTYPVSYWLMFGQHCDHVSYILLVDVWSIVRPLTLYLIGWCLVNSATTYPISYWLIVWSIVWPLILYLIGWCLVKSVTTYPGSYWLMFGQHCDHVSYILLVDVWSIVRPLTLYLIGWLFGQ